jgi:acetyl-CoA C-acetyltransferase
LDQLTPTPVGLAQHRPKASRRHRYRLRQRRRENSLACLCWQELGLPREIVNVEGGAVAYGHAIGATGAILTTRLIHSMRRDGLMHGVVTLCIGGGRGIALALEIIGR